MTNREIFQNSLFDLPKSYDNGSFPDFLNELFAQYLLELTKFSGELKTQINLKLPYIQSQTHRILQAVDYYYSGFPALAYDELSTALTALEHEDFLPIQKTTVPAERNSFYRARVSDSKTLKKEDLFHIPFNLREKVGTQRYSIPGLPCLYLADSVFVCWEELGRPNLDSFHVSRFDLSNFELKLLYFNILTDAIRKQCFTNKNKEGQLLKILTSFLCYWPLLTACSIIVKKSKEVFKPEYIIPQLLLQWIVTTKKIDGILYKSNRVKVSTHNMGTFTNVVIPARKISNYGFCSELRSKIKLTNPITLQILEIAGTKPAEETIELADLRRAMYIELFEGEKATYSETKFGILEKKLRLAQVSFLKK